MYCSESNSSWATIGDLYDRFGEEFVDKLSIRRKYDEQIQEYIADESKESKTRVQTLALCDAKDHVLAVLSKKFSDVEKLDTQNFHGIKSWHIKFTIALLKKGGDCKGCKEDFEEFVASNKICSDSTCLTKVSTFISATKARFKCEELGGRCCD